MLNAGWQDLALSTTTYSTLGQAKGKAYISNVFTFSEAHLLPVFLLTNWCTTETS
jgi:hypothetical protein